MHTKEDIFLYYQQIAPKRVKWKKRNRFYHSLLEKQYRFLVPEHSRVLEVGCGTGDLLNALKPSYGAGIDFSPNMISVASDLYPHLKFYMQDAERISLDETFDYVIMSDLLGSLRDIQQGFASLNRVTDRNSRIIITQYNFLWEPVLRFLEFSGLKAKQPKQNWLSMKEIKKLLELEGFECFKSFRKIMFPLRVPLLSPFFNKFLGNLPLLNHLCLVNFLIARKNHETTDDLSVSIIVPARNEKGNIENAVLRTPEFGTWQEFIFIEGHSKDGTFEEMLRVREKYPDRRIKADVQPGAGKGDAVRTGFQMAEGDILMILDADLTTPPEDMPKFYEAIRRNRGEFINGSRLVYPMEEEAMRLLNLLGNKFFSLFFSYLLDQQVKDTLCGTKVLRKSDYEKIRANRGYFGDFDPFGDFDLLFGASKLNMKIVEIPVRYRNREYGSTQISRFRHGWLLIRMSLFAAMKIKFT
ncbi:MAG: bifunctional class I SAM-dependent methyltransferase/glycosyltransferase family 2 protein [Bacteroidales bacterium]|nr:bifunctional class I SAM-dependent methyltransferase/glycosyltransferase family 2 protein [Bacteroidales bacterium]